jgi:hypothetical protein
MKTIKLSNELHSRLKMTAMSKGVSLQELVTKILEQSITPSKPATTPSQLDPDLQEYYRLNKHYVESTRTLMNCSLEEAIIMTIEADEELRKYD